MYSIQAYRVVYTQWNYYLFHTPQLRFFYFITYLSIDIEICMCVCMLLFFIILYLGTKDPDGKTTEAKTKEMLERLELIF